MKGKRQMTCLNPQTIFIRNSHPIDFQSWEEDKKHRYNKAKTHSHKGYTALQVPCGKCLGCKLDHANMWATRCTIEAKNWKNNCMITLTYNNPNLPRLKNGKPTLFKKDVQDFLKRLRYHESGKEAWNNPKTEKEEKPIRYFYCGEYGPTGGRPHYHMVLFNWKPNDLEFYKLNKHGDTIYKSKTLQKYWGKGFVTIEDLNYNTACYVARYCTKKAGLLPKTRFRENKPFYDKNGKIHTKYKKSTWKPLESYVNMSTGTGIGIKYWLDNCDFLKKWQYITLKINDNVKNKPLPRYFKKLWEKQDWKSYETAKYKNFKKGQEIKKELIKLDNYSDEFTEEQKWKMHLEKLGEKLKNRCRRAQILNRNAIDEDSVPESASAILDFAKITTPIGERPKESESNKRWERILTQWKAENEFYEQNIINL